MASGRPVIAYRKGGATETVLEDLTGVFFDAQTAESIKAAVERFEAMDFDSSRIRDHALKFSTERFKREFMDYVEREFRRFKEQGGPSGEIYEDRS